MDRDRPYNGIKTDDEYHNIIIPEEFPDGPYQSAFNKDEPVKRKTSTWKKGQKSISAYTYTDKAQHDDLPRRTPGAHPLHDE